MNTQNSNTIGFNRLFGMMCLWGVAALIALTASSAEAAGLNVNSDVTFTPLPSTYTTTASTTGCPAAFSGKFTFTALLTNKTGSPSIPGLTVRVVTLTNGNLLLDPQTNAVVGGEGAEMTVPKVGQYADGLLSAGESVNVPFSMCLKTFQPFQFFVDVSGVVTRLVSINRLGTGSGNSGSVAPQISADGRFVAFSSFASDFVPNDTNGTLDVFVRDLQLGTTTLVSINRLGTGSGNGASSIGTFGVGHISMISADGRYIAFNSEASDLVANDTNGTDDVFVRDLQLGRTTLVSINRFGTGSGNSSSFVSGISADGRFVSFDSGASDLVASDTNGTTDVFVRDLQTGTTTLVSVNRFGTGSGNNRSSGFFSLISADGRFVSFSSLASDLVANDNNGTTDVFVHDLQTGTTTLVSVNRFGTGSGNNGSTDFSLISADGRYVAFQSGSTDLVANDINGSQDVFVRDLQTGTTTLVSINRFGTGSANSSSFVFGISADGRFVAFESGASDLVASDTNGTTLDVFVRDLQTGTTTLVSVNRIGTGSGNSDSFEPGISADGRFVAFESGASDLVANDTNGTFDVFVRDLQLGTTTLVSINRSGTGSGNSSSGSIPGFVISGDGRFVAFSSLATDLVVANDTNDNYDLFVRPVAP